MRNQLKTPPCVPAARIVLLDKLRQSSAPPVCHAKRSLIIFWFGFIHGCIAYAIHFKTISTGAQNTMVMCVTLGTMLDSYGGGIIGKISFRLGKFKIHVNAPSSWQHFRYTTCRIGVILRSNIAGDMQSYAIRYCI